MKTVRLGERDVSAVALGCMRMAGLTVERAEKLVGTALDLGVSLFDHADLYGAGESERLFGEVLRRNPSWRNRMTIQSKCGIRAGYYDLSCGHILQAVDGILARLQLDRLDLLLFHRPDALAEPEEMSRAIETLKAQGKVGRFGVSNMNPDQIRLLEQWTGEQMAADQLQLSLMHAGMVTSGLNVNVDNREGTVQDGGVLPFCRRRAITVQAWSPLQYGMFGGCFVGSQQFPELNRELDRLARQYGVTPAAVALAWVLRIPGSIQAVVGTTDPDHLIQACAAGELTLTRPEWYGLYRACGYSLP